MSASHKKAVAVIQKKSVIPWKEWRSTMPCSEEFVEALKLMLADPKERGDAVAILADLAKTGLKVAGGVEAKNAAVTVPMQFNFDTKGRSLIGAKTSASEEETSDACRAPEPPSRILSVAPHGSPASTPKRAASE